MKPFILLVNIFLLFSIAHSQENDYTLAKAGQKIDGVIIFIGSEPYHEYNHIATIRELSWSSRTPDESFEYIIKKARKKYPNFNGLIFSSDDFTKAELIKFEGLEISRGGFSVGDKVMFSTSFSGKDMEFGVVNALGKMTKLR